MTSLFLLIGALMLMLSILLSPLSNRVGMPVLLLFLGVGMLAGQNVVSALTPMPIPGTLEVQGGDA